MVPKLSATPGRSDWAGAEVGAYNDEIYGGLLGMSAEDMKKLADHIEDIEGANTNTLISKAVKNKLKAKEYLA